MQEGCESMVFMDFIFPILLGNFYPPYGTVRYGTVPYRTVLLSTIVYSTVPYCTVQPYRTVRCKYVLTATVNPLFDILYCTVPYCTVYGTVAREDFNSKELGINIKSFSGRKIKSLSCILVYFF